MAGKRKKNTAGLHCQRGARVAARRSSKPRQPFRKERKEETRALDPAGRGGRERVAERAHATTKGSSFIFYPPFFSRVALEKER